MPTDTPIDALLSTLRRRGHVRVFPHATARAQDLVDAGHARWGDPAPTLTGGTYGRFLILTGDTWREVLCECCGRTRLVPPHPETPPEGDDMRKRAEIGDRVRERVTGLEGIVTGTHQWLTGCDTCTIQPAMADGKVPAAEHFDVWRLEVIEAGVVPMESVRDPAFTAGESGELPAPPLPGAPTRSEIAALTSRR